MSRVVVLPVVLGLVAQVACGNKPNTGEACDLLPGDLVISEVMANPLDFPDTGHEWFEVYNASSQAQVLDRLVLLRMYQASDGTVEARAHVVRGAGSLAAGEYFVFGDGVVGVQPIDYSYRNNTETFGSMGNDTGGIGLRCRYTDNQWVTIDEVWYSDVVSAGLPEVEEGRSLSFDGGVTPDHLRNDDGELWCSGGQVYDGVNLGSPGADNIACGFGACDDGGTMRDVVRPAAGDLIVSEVFGNATGNDTNKEWIEVFVAGSAVDLNGLTLSVTTSSTRSAQVTELSCIRGNPGDYLVIGGSSDTLVNGGVTVDAVAAGLDRTDGMMFNSGGAFELKRGRTVVDTAVVPEYDEGVSMSLDPLEMSATGNDLVTNFCSAQSTGVFDEIGTPGEGNDPCGSACDPGSGVLRPTNPPGVGKLVITEVYPDPTGADAGRDWFEVYVTPGSAVDLNGLLVENENLTPTLRSWTIASVDCITVPGDSYAVIGGVNAGVDNVTVAATITGSSDTLLYASEARLTLKAGVTLVDEVVNYSDPGDGASWSYDATATLTAAANDTLNDWCVATDSNPPFTGTGSPGEANGTTCP